ncbi:asparagine synthase (glutamine-hydrolysing) [Desulfobaculum xiamenense]|uniref:asparagine synthase (glutamine-hydrolyzing) n=1 Tax=Desulfobaculum xiamenense TaxID=995050 RepID=A0A846QIY8_9BACT|nr:asparagine synthase (glutamine-hydrolyzing) [Desulfobaculum xiamenense]NJB67040.1 asparagine synthase (glutamine-hydrolysing) [Desulfobaculum xiamenense]
MCGIAGFMGDPRPADFYTPVLQAMTNAMPHRGPDSSGAWADPASGIGLSHARLAILDLSPAGAQPMESPCGRFVITFNGEIYNHPALRAALEREGDAPPHGWRGHSDTETLLALISAHGLDATLPRLVGMFAFALWDRAERTLTLVRDRLGIKPLYYGLCGSAFLFGSTPSALRQHPQWTGELDREVLALYMRFLHIPEPHCIFQGIRKLPPGATLTITPADVAVRRIPEPARYWDVRTMALRGMAAPFAGNLDDATDRLQTLIDDAVGLRMLADVPLGAFLSGGIDSTAVVAAMQRIGSRPARTFTIGFDAKGYDEATHAREVAKRLGTEHTELRLSPDDALDVIPLLPRHFDEPFADVSQIPTLIVSRLAREHVTVALSGDGGDELFGGYSRHLFGPRLWNAQRRIPLPLRRAMSAMLKGTAGRMLADAYERAENLLAPAQRHAIFRDKLLKVASALSARDRAQFHGLLVSCWNGGQSPVRGADFPESTFERPETWPPNEDFAEWMMTMDMTTYLPGDILTKVDRASMAVSLEARVPLLDHRICEFALSLPASMKIADGKGKLPLRRLLARHLPPELMDRPKQGFSVPIDSWLRGPLRPWAEELLDVRALREDGWLDPDPIRRKWREHLAGKFNWQYHLWAVLMFRAWITESAPGA